MACELTVGGTAAACGLCPCRSLPRCVSRALAPLRPPPLQETDIAGYNHQVIASLLDAFIRRNPDFTHAVVDALLRKTGAHSKILSRFCSVLAPTVVPSCRGVKLMSPEEVYAFE